MLTIPPAVKLWSAPQPVAFRLGFDGPFAPSITRTSRRLYLGGSSDERSGAPVPGARVPIGRDSQQIRFPVLRLFELWVIEWSAW